MSIIKTVSRGKVYYQVRKGKKVVRTLGSEEKILVVFQYWDEMKLGKLNTDK